MPRNTIVPGHHPGNPDVDPTRTERWRPEKMAVRHVDVPRPSAYPEERRFVTIHPGTKASADATDAAWRASVKSMQEHDRVASTPFLDLLEPRDDEDDA
jgi:hypothetical protein